jgi:selenocysteine lyase/cysteine desulfurase
LTLRGVKLADPPRTELRRRLAAKQAIDFASRAGRSPPAMKLGRRDLFDVPEDVAYLNAAYIGPAPRQALKVAHEAIDARRARPWTIQASDFFTEADAARKLAARLFGGDSEGIAVVPSASYGLATAAKNLRLARGEEVLVMADGFPSDLYTWLVEAKAVGAKVTQVPRRQGETWAEAILEAMTPATRVVSTFHTHWCDGGYVDLEALGQETRARGAALVLDLTQSLGVLPFDAAKVKPDFAVSACYKWLCGPYSIGFLYVAPEHRNGLGIEQNWVLRSRSEDFANLIDYDHTYASGARRFDMGERAQFQLMPQAMIGLELLLELDPANTAAALGDMNEDMARRLEKLGCRAETLRVRAPHYLMARAPSDARGGIVKELHAQKIYISQRGPNLRITPHVHVTDRDVDRLIDALAARLR